MQSRERHLKIQMFRRTATVQHLKRCWATFSREKEERLSQLVAEAIQFGTSGRKTNESAT